MSTIVMTERLAKSSPQFKARLAGSFSLLTRKGQGLPATAPLP
jgi:hypothetical protein